MVFGGEESVICDEMDGGGRTGEKERGVREGGKNSMYPFYDMVIILWYSEQRE